MPDQARLEKVIAPEAEALGFELVRVKMTSSEAGDGAMALQIMAEDPATGQLLIEQCAALSRRVSEKLDEMEAAGDVLVEGAYHLEVSSPGIDRPLTRPKDFANWAGHDAKLSLTKKVHGHRNIRGPLIGIEGDIGSEMVAIEDNKGKRVDVPLSLIHSAKLVLTDALIAATKPLDTAGAAEVDDTIDEIDDTIDEIDEEKADD